MVTTVVETAACTESFGYAQRNPFQAFLDKNSEVCMPDSIVLPTGKRRLLLKGSGSTGTTGVGFLIGIPYNPSNDTQSAIVSTAASVGGTATAFSAFTNTITPVFANSSYAAADFSAGNVEFRTAAYGIRLRFKGTNLNEGGSVYAYRSPSNTDIWTLKPDDLIPLSTTKSYDFTKEWVTLRWKIATPNDTDFASTTSTSGVMVLVVVSATGSPQPFEYQAVTFHELVGGNVNTLTESHSDPVGFGAVQAVGARGSDSFNGKGPSKGAVVSEIGGTIQKSTSHVKQVVSYGKKFLNAAGQGMQMYNSIKGAGFGQSSGAGYAQIAGPKPNYNVVDVSEIEELGQGMELIAI